MQQHISWEQKVSILVSELKECRRNKDLKRGSEIHSQLNSCPGLSRNKYVVTSLIKMYAAVGSMSDAKHLFDHSRLQHNVVAWNCLISGYVENGESSAALELFSIMQTAWGCSPCSRTFVAALTACSNLAAAEEKSARSKCLERGSAVHSRAVELNCCDMFVQSALVDFYAISGRMNLARGVFDSMLNRDVVAWTALLQGYVDNGQSELALELYHELIRAGKVKVDGGIHVAALSALVVLAGNCKDDRGRLFELGRKIHSRSVVDGSCNIFVESMVLTLYGRCGKMPESRYVFDRLVAKDVVCWNALLQGYVDNGDNLLALEIFQKMVNGDSPKKVAPNARTYVAAVSALAAAARDEAEKDRRGTFWVRNALITMYSHCGSLLQARRVFDSISNEAKDLVTWNALITGFVSVLMACTSLLEVETGRAAHAGICCKGQEDCTAVVNCLLDFYAKCGSFEAGVRVFDGMVERTVVSWNTLMSGYTSQGDTERVFQVFHEMQELRVRADEITFICLLTACNHGGLADTGRKIFDTMEERYGVERTMQHFNCMVDLLGRANRVDEAVRLIREMPFEGNDVTWRGILCACRKWNNVEVGKMAYDQLMRLDAKDSSAYVILWRLLDAAGLSEEKSPRVPGVTCWIDSAGKKHRFSTERLSN